MEKIFEKAIRNKMRFAFKGQLSVEDLWDLNVKSLDTIYKGLNSQLKEANEESLLNMKTKQDEETEIKIEIVKYIVAIKLAEADAKSKEKEKRERKQKLLAALESKEDQALEEKSADEIRAMLESL